MTNTTKFFKLFLRLLPLITVLCSCATEQDGTINNWDIVKIDFPVPLIADIRNDGIKRSYVIEGGSICEYYYDNENQEWVRTELGGAGFSESVPLVAAKCYLDDKNRLYGFSNGIQELEYVNGAWSIKLIYSITDSPYENFFKGDSRKEGIDSLYLYYYSDTESDYILGELSHRLGFWNQIRIFQSELINDNYFFPLTTIIIPVFYNI